MSDTVYLDREVIPRCDFCGEDGKTVPARYDFRTSFGPWANGCERHYRAYRADQHLGTGKGQRIVPMSTVWPANTITVIRTVQSESGQPLGRIRADWAGGPYVSLTFTEKQAGYIPSRPTEVINVWDDDTNRPELDFTLTALDRGLGRWIEDWEGLPSEWFQSYLDNR